MDKDDQRGTLLAGELAAVKAEHDEGELLEALEPLPVRYKKLSPMEARKVIPDVDSLFQVSSESGCVAGQATSSVGHTLSA